MAIEKECISCGESVHTYLECRTNPFGQLIADAFGLPNIVGITSNDRSKGTDMTEAPERISIDTTSEDSGGFFIAARTSDGYANHDSRYVRADLLDDAIAENERLEKTLRNASILAAYDMKRKAHD